MAKSSIKPVAAKYFVMAVATYAGYISDGGYNCPFCREPHVDNDEEHNNKMVMKRVEAKNDPNALCRMGGLRYHLASKRKSKRYDCLHLHYLRTTHNSQLDGNDDEILRPTEVIN